MAVAFGWPGGRQDFPLARGAPFGCGFRPRFFTGICFAVEFLRFDSRAADITQVEDLDFEISPVIGNAEHVPDAHLTGCFSRIDGSRRSGRGHTPSSPVSGF